MLPNSAPLAAAVILASGSLSLAQTNALPERPITLQEAFELALRNNLDIRIEQLNPLMSRANINIAWAAYDPTFRLSGTHGYSESGGGLDENQRRIPTSTTDSHSFNSGLLGSTPWGMSYSMQGSFNERYGSASGFPFDSSGGSAGFTSLSQPLLRNFLIDSPRYQIALNKNLLKVSEQRLQLQIMTVLSTVERAYYELIFARENVNVQQTGLELAQRLFRENRRRVEIGTMAPLDEKQAESQMAARQTDLTSALRTLASAQNNLKALVTGNYRELHGQQLQPTGSLMAVPQSLDLQESWGKGLALRPDVLQARLDLERQGITLKYYKNQILPQLDLTGSYGYNASGNTLQEFSDTFAQLSRREQPFWSGGAVFSIPLFNKAARERYRSGKLTVEQALLSLKKMEESVLVQIDEAFNQVTTTFSQVQSTRQARIYAEEALQAEQKKLEVGKSTSFVVLSLQRDLTAARSDEIRALTEYNKALAQLAFEEGSTLTRDNIKIQVK